MKQVRARSTTACQRRPTPAAVVPSDIMTVVIGGGALSVPADADAAPVAAAAAGAVAGAGAPRTPVFVKPAAAGGDVDDTISIIVKRLDGSEFEMVVNGRDTVRDVKGQLEVSPAPGLAASHVLTPVRPQALTSVPVPGQAIIFKGFVLADHVTVREAGIVSRSLVHLVRRNVNLTDVYNKEDLRINCRFCHVAGAMVAPRALCARCGCASTPQSCARACACACVCVYLCACACVRTCACACVCVPVRVSLCLCLCMCMCARVCAA